jgi:hypothetical protein
MKALHDLFSTDYGLMSISGIVFMLGMVFSFCAISVARWMKMPGQHQENKRTAGVAV